MEYDDFFLCLVIICTIWMAIVVVRTERRNNRLFGKGWRKKLKQSEEEYHRKLFRD